MRFRIEYSRSPEAETPRERNIKLTHIGDMKDINLTLRPDAV